jgi:hypothetical protein
MAQVERIRQRDGLTKRQVCYEIGTNKSVLHDWLAGEVIARKESITKIKAFLTKRETSRPRLQPVRPQGRWRVADQERRQLGTGPGVPKADF